MRNYTPFPLLHTLPPISYLLALNVSFLGAFLISWCRKQDFLLECLLALHLFQSTYSSDSFKIMDVIRPSGSPPYSQCWAHSCCSVNFDGMTSKKEKKLQLKFHVLSFPILPLKKRKGEKKKTGIRSSW